jgi:hypothetical protein
MVTVALFMRLEAKPGKEADVAYTKNSLLDLRALWLRDAIHAGLRVVGFTQPDRRPPLGQLQDEPPSSPGA